MAASASRSRPRPTPGTSRTGPSASRSRSSTRTSALIVIDKPAGSRRASRRRQLERHAAERAARARARARSHSARRHRAPARQGHERAAGGREERSRRKPISCASSPARTVKREYLALVHGRVARDGTMRRADRPAPAQPHAHGRGGARTRGGDALRGHRALRRLPPCCAAASRPAARTRSACTSPRWASARRRSGLRQARERACAFARQALHAERLALVHPQTRRNVSWQSDPPADMQELLATLRDELRAAPSLDHRRHSRR